MPEVCAAEVLHEVSDEGDGGVDVNGPAEVVVAVHVAARDAEDEDRDGLLREADDAGVGAAASSLMKWTGSEAMMPRMYSPSRLRIMTECAGRLVGGLASCDTARGFPSIDRTALPRCSVLTACYDILYLYLMCFMYFCDEI